MKIIYLTIIDKSFFDKRISRSASADVVSMKETVRLCSTGLAPGHMTVSTLSTISKISMFEIYLLQQRERLAGYFERCSGCLSALQLRLERRYGEQRDGAFHTFL